MRQFVLTAMFVAISAVGGAAAEGKKLALLVGVEKYKHQDLTPLKYCCDDVKTLAGVLAKQGFTCRLLADDGFDLKKSLAKPTDSGEVVVHGLPNRSTISVELKKLLDGVGRDDLILIVLSGHGLQPLGATQPYFCPLDANPTIKLGTAESGGKYRPTQELTRPETMLGIGDLLGQLKESGIGQKFVLIDACRNAPATKGSKNAGAASVAINLVPENCSVLMSCSAGEQSFEDAKFGPGGRGAFLNAVIEGIEGGAANAKGEVTWGNLANFVPERVKESMVEVFGDNQHQTPNEIKNSSTNPVLAISASRPTSVPNSGPSIPMKSATSPSGKTELLFEDFRTAEEFGLPDGWVLKTEFLGVRQFGRAHLRTAYSAYGKQWDQGGFSWGTDSGKVSTVSLPPILIVGDFELEMSALSNESWHGKRTLSVELKGPEDEKLVFRTFEAETGFVASMPGSDESLPFSLAGKTPYRYRLARSSGTYNFTVNAKSLLTHEADDHRVFHACELTLSPNIYVGSIRIGPPGSGKEVKDAPTKTKSTSKRR